MSEASGFYNDVPHNEDLFFNSQMESDKLTWRLIGPKNKKLLKGPILDTNVGASYSVGHEYSGVDKPGLVSKGEDLVKRAMALGRSTDMGAEKALSELNKFDGLGDKLINGANSGIKSATGWIDGLIGSDLTGGYEKAKAGATKLYNAARPYMYGGFVSAFDFIKVFQGTSVDITLPTLDVIILDYEDQGKPLKKILKDLNNDMIGDIESLGGLWGIQKAPSDYKPKFEGLDKTVKMDNTFELYVGDKFHFQDLVVTNFNVNISPIKRKGSTQPLYAEVSVQLAFASYVTKEKLNDYVLS